MKKVPLLLLSILVSSLCIQEAKAESRAITVLDKSSSGKLVKLDLGGKANLRQGEAVLMHSGPRKVAAGRVVRMNGNSAIIAVLEKYSDQNPGDSMELLFGEPFDEAENLPDYVADRDLESPNPANERFFTADGEEIKQGPDLDDENYSPEVSLKPKMPDSKIYSPHNITLAVDMFRNRDLVSDVDANGQAIVVSNSYSMYQGYSLRYAYTFRTNYWVRQRVRSLISVEGSVGIYHFTHTFPGNQVIPVQVIPLAFDVRYMIDISKIFFLYPYIGYQNNIVSAQGGSSSALTPLKGGRLLGGLGAELAMSDTIDFRLDAGTDGVLIGLVTKF